MRSAFFRLLHSLALRLLVTYVAALLVTMGCIAAAIWFSADQAHALKTPLAVMRAQIE